jgi:hypothetical protein
MQDHREGVGVVTVYAFSSTSVDLPVSGSWDLSVLVADDTGAASDTTPTVTVTLPAGGTATPTMATDTLGIFRAVYLPGAEGRYVARVVAAGLGAVDFTAYVTATVAGTAMPAISDVDAYLGQHSWTDDELTDALAAEASAQRDVCDVPAAYPDSLRQALLRRVARNLSMRALPLAVLRGDAEASSTYIPRLDAEVRRFEAPHRKLPIG